LNSHKMVAVYGSFEEVEAARPKAAAYRKYAGALVGAWAVLFVAAVLIVGNASAPQESMLVQGKAQRTQMLAFKDFVPERNVMDEFDADFTPEMKFDYDLANEADFAKINIASGVDGDEVTEGIPDPYADQSPRIEVPDAVYTQDPPYDTSVVEIGEKVRLF